MHARGSGSILACIQVNPGRQETRREEAMKILVFGAGVIGIAYAWQLSEAGHDVALLVRLGRKKEIQSKGIFHLLS